ncbi:MAG: hypothetical protein ACRBB5_01490 [Nitrosopumilus sp.]
MKVPVIFAVLFGIISLLTGSSIDSSYAESSVNVDEEQMIALIGTGVDPDNDTLTFGNKLAEK